MRAFQWILLPVGICFFAPATAAGQDTIHLHPGVRWDTAYIMMQYAGYYIDTGNREEMSTVIQKPFLPFHNYKEVYDQYKSIQPTLWMKWIIGNSSKDTEDVQVIFQKLSFFTAYYRNEQGIRLLKSKPPFFTREKRIDRMSLFFKIPPGEMGTLYVSFSSPQANFFPSYPVIIQPVLYKQMMQSYFYEHRYGAFLNIVFLAIVFFILLHTLAQFFFNRRKEFLLYVFYTGVVLLFFLFKLDVTWYSDITFSHFPYIQKYANIPLTYLVFFAYFRFIREFINFRNIAGWFYRVLIVIEKTLLLVIVLDILIITFGTFPLRGMLFNTVRISLIGVAVIGLYLLFSTRDRLNLIIAVGSGSFVTGGLIAMLYYWMLAKPNVMDFDGTMYMQIGMVLELICFTMGLSYKTSLIEKEKKATQKQLIAQLEENEKLQEELNNRLEVRVKEQMDHIIAQQKQIEKEKEQQLILEFTQKITEMELQLLKSQLNPHFYFNTLNNLYGLAMIAPKKAPKAILKLSDIMEYVIYDCHNDKVTLSKELKFINSYVELEKLRYDDSTVIRYEADTSTNGNMISPLLLIQFIENAFKHGLEESKHNSYLHIRIRIQQNELYYESVNSLGTGFSGKGGGVGLANVKKRLEMIYPGKHRLEISADEDVYKVCLRLQLT